MLFNYFLAVEVGGEEGRVLRVRDDLGLDGLRLRRRDLRPAAAMPLAAAAAVLVVAVLRRRRTPNGGGGGLLGLVQRERRAVVRAAAHGGQRLELQERRLGAPSPAPENIPEAALIHRN